MAREVELCSLDLRYEGCRMKNAGLEGRLLTSMAQGGIQEALEGVEVKGASILLNGFKRYRCARKLQLRTLPYAAVGEDEAAGIMNLLRLANNRGLSILEQAAFLDELNTTRHLSVAQIAQELSRSKSWVSMRLGLIAEMSEAIRAKLFSGAFPVYPYMYTLRQFRRMNGVTGEQVEQFVTAVSGQQLSVREIEQLANGFFKGPDSLRQEILKGNVALSLKRLRDIPQNPDGCSEFERVLLGDLELTQKYMQRVMGKSQDQRLKSRVFHAQANLLSAGILSRLPALTQSLKQLHDRTGQA